MKALFGGSCNLPQAKSSTLSKTTWSKKDWIWLKWHRPGAQILVLPLLPLNKKRKKTKDFCRFSSSDVIPLICPHPRQSFEILNTINYKFYCIQGFIS
jgi:hypothetical protein